MIETIQYVARSHESDPRTAIEAQLLGCRTVVVEGRTGFTRNNVLKLWKFLIEVGFLLFSSTYITHLLQDLKQLGVKKLYGKFCSGNINHICIKTLQVHQHKTCFAMSCIKHKTV